MLIVPRAVAVILDSSCGLLCNFTLHYVLSSSFCTWAGISSCTSSVLLHKDKGNTSKIFLMTHQTKTNQSGSQLANHDREKYHKKQAEF